MRKYFIGAACALAAVGVMAQSNLKPYYEGRSICVPYDPSSLRLVPDGDAWQVWRGDGAILKAFDNREDADAGLAIAKQYTRLCYIGKDNKRPQRETYIMEYWK